MMKTYAQELLQQQGKEQQEAARRGIGGGNHAALPSGRPASSLPASCAGIELLVLGSNPLERPTHFQLGPTIGTPRQRTASGGAAGSDAANPAHSALRSSIGWVTTSCSAGAGSEVVLEHRVAGDLIIPTTTIRATMGTASPARDLHRHPLLTTSTTSSAGTSKPCDAPPGAATSPTKAPADSSDDSDDGKGDDMESLDYEGQQKPWWKKKKFWLIAGPLLVSLAFVLAGILYLIYGQDHKVGEFQLWRLCFFIAGLPIIWWIGRGSMDLAVWAVERTMFTWQNALYYCYAVRRPMANVLRAALVTGWWALMMTAFAGQMNSTMKTWYDNVLRLWGCLTLFMTANLLKVLFAKMLASKFNAHSHYEKMHQALKREYLLHLMLQPRQRYTEFEEQECGECDGEDDDMLRPPKSTPLAHHKVEKQRTLVRLFQRSSRVMDHAHNAPPMKSKSNRKLKDRVMFWRASQEDLQAIDESEEANQQGDEDEGLPPYAVAVDISSGAQSVWQEEPLLDHSAPPVVRTGAAGTLTLPTSVPASPAKQPSPTKPPVSPISKLNRLRSDALEAAGVEQQGTVTPRAASLHSPHAPHVRILTSDSEFAARRQAVQPAEDGGGSRDASLKGGRAFARATRLPVQRSASITSLKSVRSVQHAAPSAHKQPMVHHASTISSSSSNNKQLMALRMSKMEKYIRKHALEVTFKDALSRTERSEQVNTELEAKKLGFYLFHNVKAAFEREYIVLEDLEQFLEEKDAKAALDMLDDDENGQVNVQECCTATAKVFVERRNLAASLKDARTIVGTLETLIGVFLHIFMGFIYLLIWNVDVLKAWAGFASLFLGFSFIFGNSIRTTYENVVFLFVVHPYDVGDSVWVDKEQQKVEEIHLSFTVLTNSNNQRVWYPNEKIRLIPFVNISTSGNKGEAFKVLVDLGTPFSALEDLRAAAADVIKANPKEFNGTLSTNLTAANNPLKMTLSVYWEYTHSGADGGCTGRNRTKMYAALSEAMTRAGVRYTWPASADGPTSRPASFAVGGATDAVGPELANKLL